MINGLCINLFHYAYALMAGWGWGLGAEVKYCTFFQVSQGRHIYSMMLKFGDVMAHTWSNFLKNI